MKRPGDTCGGRLGSSPGLAIPCTSTLCVATLCVATLCVATLCAATLCAATLGVDPASGGVRAAHGSESRPSLNPAWMHWLGWARDNRFVAWRQGEGRGGNRPGAPCWLAEVGSGGKLLRPRLVTANPKKRLLEHDIHGRIWVRREQVTGRDVLMRTRRGVVLTTVVRDSPDTLAVLRKWRGEYELAASRRVPGPVSELEAQAFESPDGSMVAVLARTVSKRGSEAAMFILPLRGPPAGAVALDPPNPSTPTQAPATQAPAAAVPPSHSSTPTQRR